MPAPTTQPVFLSYAREDTDATRRIADALRSHGIEVWFDQSELRGGDAWDQKLRRQIKECALFVPIISAHTEQRREGYFRLEWKLAVERTHLMAEGVPFLTPVVVDDTSESAAVVPAEFMRVQWTRLPGALVTPQFIEQIKRLLAAPVMETGRPRPVERGEGAASPAHSTARPTRSGFPIWAAAALGVAVLGLVAFIALRPTGKEPATPTAPAKPVAAEKSASPATPPAPKISAKSIAILPLANMSDDKDTGFFADGVHEDLLTNLALVPELKVISRTSVLQYRGTTKTMKQIGAELGVAYLLEGSVRRAGNKVRVTAQLINTRTDEHAWARSYDRDLTDIFAIQAALSQEIAGALSAAISPQTQKLLQRRPTENPVAYDLYLQGRDTRNRAPTASQAALARAETLFQRAVEADPSFAAAWGELAVVHALKVFWERDTSSEQKARGDAAIARASSLGSDAPDINRLVGTFAYYAYRDYARAAAAYEKIIQLQPNDPTGYASLGLIQRRQGRWAESLAHLRRAVELDPANATYLRNLISTLMYVRRWEEAEAVQRRLVALLPDQLWEQLTLAELSFTAQGSFKAIDELLARLTPTEKDSPVVIFKRKTWALVRDDYAEFKRLDALQPHYPDQEQPGTGAIYAAAMHLAHGEAETARKRIEGAFAEIETLTQKEPAYLRARLHLGAMEAIRGRPDEAVRLARNAVDLMPESRDALDGFNCLYWLAQVYALSGDKDRAIAELGRLARLPGNTSPAWIRRDPSFAALRGDPRFEALFKDPKNNAPLF
jgi:TolB-like protein/Flp pilus assembly protein TadD